MRFPHPPMTGAKPKEPLSAQFASYGRYMKRYLAPHWRAMSGLMLLMLVGIALSLVNPRILRYFIDTARSPDGTDRQIFIAAGIFVLIALFEQVAIVLRSWQGASVAWSSTNALRNDLAAHCLRQDMAFHKNHTPGELIQRIDGDTATLGNFFSTFLLEILGTILMISGALVMLGIEDIRIMLLLVAFVSVVGTLLYFCRKIAIKAWVEAFQADAELFGFLEERLAATEDVRASGAVPYVLHRFNKAVRKLWRASLKGRLRNLLPMIVIHAGFFIGQTFAMGVGIWFFLKGRITLGTIFMIGQYFQMIQGPLIGLTRQVQYLQQAGASVERITGLFDSKPRILDGPGAPLPPAAPRVTFRNVAFSYTPDKPVIRGVSFSLEPGRRLGLLGRTGSGKTTLTRLLFRLYEPQEGEILLDDINIRQTRLHDLRGHIGLVTQEVQLFRATVRDNMTFFDPGLTDDKIFEAMGRLGIAEWCRRLPQGLDTVLGDQATGLSAGEAQLLAFTRIFLSDPKLVILDEASSRLDPATEGLLERAVDRLLTGRTGIIIAHRLSTVRRADRILILDDGRVAEEGERTALEADPQSRFAELLRTGLEEVLA